MALITTVGGSTSNSYVTAIYAGTYLSGMYGATSWANLSSVAAEERLKLAALIMNTFKYRGLKSCQEQNLAFPRWGVESDVYAKNKRYEKYDAVEDYPWWEDMPASSMQIDTGDFLFKQYAQIGGSGYVPPIVPTEAMEAQCEIAYQVVHSVLMTMTPLQVPSGSIATFGLGGSLDISFTSTKDKSRSVYFDRTRLDTTAIIELKLHKWRRTFIGAVV